MLLKGKTIFIVEDNHLYLNVALIYLSRQGATVHFCRRPPDIINKILEVLPVDIILMDLMLTDNKSGFDVFSELRSVPALHSIPIVAVSASDPDASMPRARDLGFAGYIAKPITYQIPVHVADVLSGKEVWIADSYGYW